MESWLKDNVHRYGSTYTLQDLFKKNEALKRNPCPSGRRASEAKVFAKGDEMGFDPDLIGVNPKVNLDYLEKKYSKIYDF